MRFSLDRLPLSTVPLHVGPTRVQWVPELGIHVQREDEVGSLYGGAKVRNLEWLLGAAQEHGGEILTFGLVGSHHVLATAVYGAAAGLRVQAVLLPQQTTPLVRQHARITHAHAERLWPVPEARYLPWVWSKAWLATRVFSAYAPMVISPGGNQPLGCLGWVQGGLELASLIQAGDLPCPRRIYVAAGTGTVAGLLIGLRLAGVPSEIVAVDVVGRALVNRATIARLIAGTMAILWRHGAPLISPDGFRVVHPHHMAATQRAVQQATALGIPITADASGQALAVCLEEGGPDRLFLHTDNTSPLEPLLRSALDDVPASLVHLLR